MCCEQANNQIKNVTKIFLYCVIIIYYVINDLMKIRRYMCVVKNYMQHCTLLYYSFTHMHKN